MKKLLLVIDMQNDFLTGSLKNDDGVKIIPKIVELVKEYKNNNDDIIFTKDTHYDNYLETTEGKHLPIVHCVNDTFGHEICHELEKFATKVINKDHFGALNEFKDYDFSKYESITLVGVCTDICVLSNAIILKNMYPNTRIIVLKDLTAATSKENQEASLKVLKSMQIEVI